MIAKKNETIQFFRDMESNIQRKFHEALAVDNMMKEFDEEILYHPDSKEELSNNSREVVAE
jgi:hypothetical protein